MLRNFEAGDERAPWHPLWMPNRKTDTNNNGAFSTDFIGMSDAYPEADDATRAQIARAHEDYIRGFLTFLATSPRVALSVVPHGAGDQALPGSVTAVAS